MAKPIIPTPTLENEDAELFLADICNIKYDSEKEKFLKDCVELFEKTQKHGY